VRNFLTAAILALLFSSGCAGDYSSEPAATCQSGFYNKSTATTAQLQQDLYDAQQCMGNAEADPKVCGQVGIWQNPLNVPDGPPRELLPVNPIFLTIQPDCDITIQGEPNTHTTGGPGFQFDGEWVAGVTLGGNDGPWTLKIVEQPTFNDPAARWESQNYLMYKANKYKGTDYSLIGR
jgi:hypothetical protein